MTEEKSRDLSIFEYFEQLQIEYICAELRKRIYPVVKDKKYYKRVMEQKKIKIDDIASRNDLVSIFTEGEEGNNYRKEMYGGIYNKKGLPNFIYRDQEMQSMFEESDINFYYLEGGEVKIVEENKSMLVGTIESVDLLEKRVKVKLGKKVKDFSMENVTRIL